MSQELEEKVARAISPFWFTEDGSPPIINNYPDQHLHYQEKARVAARAALAVVREEMAEPTPAMLNAGYAAYWKHSPGEGQTGNPNVLTMIATLPATQEDERKLHLYFSHLHVRGEWFLRGDDLIEYIGGLGGSVDCFGAEEFEGRDLSPFTYGTTMPATE